MQEMNQPVVVGLDGSADAMRAVEFAVQEARRWSCGVRLVFAAHESVPVTPTLPLLSSETVYEAAHRIATETAAEVDRLSGGEVPTEVVVDRGFAVRVLLRAAGDARVIVLGHRDLNSVARIFTGSTTIGVAARANCPVVSVSPSWKPATTYGWVLVGVDGSSASREVLAAAFAAAAARAASLRVLHAWRLTLAYDDLHVHETMNAAERWRAESEPALAEILTDWRDDYPDVHVEVDLRYERPADALVSASESADLVVVGRHGHGGRLAGITGVPLGSIARAMIQHSRCPVEITPHRTENEQEPGA